MGGASFAKAGADATNNFIETYAKGRAERAQMKATQRENERLNKLSWQAMGNQINTVNLQRGILRQATGTDLYNIQREANRASSKSLSNAAAAGVVGASVDDAASDIQRQNNEAQARTRNNQEIQEVNLDTQVSDIIDSAVARQRYSQRPTSNMEIIGRAVGTSSMTFISSLAGSSFDYTPSSGSQWTQGSEGGSTGNNSSSSAVDPSTGQPYDFTDVTSRFNGYSGGQADTWSNASTASQDYGFGNTYNFGNNYSDAASAYNFNDTTSLFNFGSS
ncbi:hypothetical protein [Pantoea phage LIMEzero]|uniref:Internal virion protein B n=1 Tax=Pantoea phage LIMEzero TaxID=943335 RepID=F4N9U6_9CAUD|nr:internal virion protein [Pantoea phage LIMEzero]CBY88574.1 hypothetical protein [Pantoea phage LIMEzero]